MPVTVLASSGPAEPVTAELAKGIDGLRISLGGGYFRKGLGAEGAEAFETRRRCAEADARSRVAGNARAHARPRPVISTAEGASLHLPRLRTQPLDFDPVTRDRLISGALVPAPFVDKAQKFRRWYRAQCARGIPVSRCDHYAGYAIRCAEARAADHRARRRRAAVARQHRPLYAADFVHRLPGLHRAVCRCHRCRSAFRSSQHPGARTSCSGLPNTLRISASRATPAPPSNLRISCRSIFPMYWPK